MSKYACRSPKLIFTFLYANSRIENASEQSVSSAYLPFLNLALQPTPTNKNLTELCLRFKQLSLDNHSELDTILMDAFNHNVRNYQAPKLLTFPPELTLCTALQCRSHWPHVLRRRSAAARLLRLWVRIPRGSWMSVCCECYVLSGTGLCDELINRPEESYRMWCVVVYDLETS